MNVPFIVIIKLFSSFLGLLVFTLSVKANPVDTSIVKKVAFTLLMKTTTDTIHTVSEEDLEFVFAAKNEGKPVAFYVINGGGGFVIVSGDDRVTPILGYSNSGFFDPNNIPPSLSEFLKGFQDEIDYITSTNHHIYNSDIKKKWKFYIDEVSNLNTNGFDETRIITKDVSIKKETIIQKNLIKTKWGQDIGGYNDLCPIVDSTKALTGCVATAMGQIIKYWSDSVSVTNYGSHSYIHPIYGKQIVDFGSTTYNFKNMPVKLDKYSSTSNIMAIAELLYHCGVSVDTEYGATYSGASIYDAGNALNTFFGFPNAQYKFLDKKTAYNVWETMIKNEIDNKRPILYSGPGHAFICDGYNSDDFLFFHLNWGWAGYCDGFFLLTALNPDLYDLFYHIGRHQTSVVINIEPGTIIFPTNISWNLWKNTSLGSDYYMLKPLFTHDTIILDNDLNNNIRNYVYTIEGDSGVAIGATPESNNPSVVKVSTENYFGSFSGWIKVEAIAPGDATVTITSDVYDFISKSCHVTVYNSLTDLLLSKKNITMTIGQKDTLNVLFNTGANPNSLLTWEHKNNKIVSFNPNNVIVAKAAGKDTIVVKSGEYTDTCFITVIKHVSEMHLNKYTTALSVESSKKIFITSLSKNQAYPSISSFVLSKCIVRNKKTHRRSGFAIRRFRSYLQI